MKKLIALLFFTWSTFGSGSASAESSEGSLTEESMNPLSTVISIPFENNTLFKIGPSESTASVLNIKPVFPVSLGEWNLINRIVVPLVYTEGQDQLLPFDINWGGNPGTIGLGSASGLADITYQGFITSSAGGEIAWGFGGALVIPTHSEPRFGSDKWSAGPAVVMFATPGKWVLGAIAQNIWSIAGDNDAADVNVFTSQFTINYKLGNRWYLTSSPLITANWEAEKDNRWTVPLGGGIGRAFKIGNQAVAIDAGAYYNVEKPRFANEWYSQVLVNFLFPKK